MKNLTLKKDQIKSIKYFINLQAEAHKYGSWDKFKISSLKIHSNGYYFFKVNWMESYAGVFDDIWVEGNLFEEFPVFAVLDGLDAVQLLFHKIHIKACERLKKRANEMIESYNLTYDHLKQIYTPGGLRNKENKTI